MSLFALGQGLPVLLAAATVIIDLDPLFYFLDLAVSSNIIIRFIRFFIVALSCYFADLYINTLCIFMFFQLSLLSWVVYFMFEWSLKLKKNSLGISSECKIMSIRNQINILSDINVKRKAYVKLYLFSSLVNQTYSCFLSWATFLGGLLLVLCNYACIKMTGKIQFLFIIVFFGISLCAFLIIVTICPLLESLYETSVLFLQNISSVVGNHNILKRQVVSCRPCRIVVCPLFFAKKSTKCSYFDNCFQFTVNALLLF